MHLSRSIAATTSSFLLLLALSAGFRPVLADDKADSASCGVLLNRSLLDELRQEAESASSKERRLRERVQKEGIKKVAINQALLRKHNDHYNHVVPEADVIDQMRVGDCWEESGCNVERNKLVAEGKVDKDFQFSVGFLHFHNLLEKSDKWLAGITQGIKPGMKNSQLRSMLSPVGVADDGGFYEFFQFLAAKYGMVPKSAMPETESMKNSERLLQELQNQLGAIAEEMRKKYRAFETAADSQELTPAQVKALQDIRRRGIGSIYKILATHLGIPPKEFVFKGLDGAERTYTPQSFMKEFVGYDPNDYVVIMSDPMLRMRRHYEVPDSSIGVPGPGDPGFNIRFLNLPRKRMLGLVEAAIDHGHSVWFGADVDRDVDEASGIMHPAIFNGASKAYDFAGDEKFRPIRSVKKGIYYKLSQLNHAMTFTGYDKPEGSAKTVKYRVENSWGKKPGRRGIFAMYPQWFDKNVFEIVVPKALLSPEEMTLLSSSPKSLNPDLMP